VLNPNVANKHKYLDLNTKLEVTHFCEVSGLWKTETGRWHGYSLTLFTFLKNEDKDDHVFYVTEDYDWITYRMKIWNLPFQVILFLLKLHPTELCQTLNNVLPILIF
jgi:hypothetical protein